MAKIAVILADLFEDAEYTKPAEAFKKAGHKLVHIGLKANQEVKGKKKATPVTIEQAVKDVSPAEFDALLIPGGYSPDKLRAYPEPVAFVRDFVQSGKPVFSICHGPQLLITARVLEGRRITGWKSIKQDIINAGAEYLDQAVVVDDDLVSSRHPGDLPVFIKNSLKKLS